MKTQSIQSDLIVLKEKTDFFNNTTLGPNWDAPSRKRNSNDNNSNLG
jgi:hypothetical protein